MNSNMSKLINKLDLSDECKNELLEAKLNKIVGNSSKTCYCFYIDNYNIISLNSYLELNNKLKDLYSDIECICKFNISNINYDILSDYYKYIIDYYSKESRMLDIFKDSKIEINNNVLSIYVDNEAECA